MRLIILAALKGNNWYNNFLEKGLKHIPCDIVSQTNQFLCWIHNVFTL